MKRRGYSLLEMTIVISILTVLLSAAAMLLTSLLMHTGRQRASYHEAQVATRFAAALRRDVRAATEIDSTDPTRLLLTCPGDSQVEYQAVVQGVERFVRTGDQIRQRELFRLPDLQDLRFERAAGDEQLVVCVWKRHWRGPQQSEQDAAALRGHRIVAAARREAHDE